MQQRTPAEVLRLVQDEGVEIVDFRFIDLPGLTQHFSVPAHALTDDLFEEGIGFDGSSIRGFQEIQESDMLLFPDPNTAVVDPFREHKTAEPELLRPRPDHPRVVLTRPALHRSEGRGLPEDDGHRRHVLFRTRSRVLHLRRCPATPRTDTRRSTRSTRSRVTGTAAWRGRTERPTSGTRSARRRVTSRFRRLTTSRTCAPR